ncbi:unnamed protein product [Prorocentrum cordatum]|uniref:Uncharacterized protein n=1 Tax=Prorocentrum cordatum TaxID=2364126 RepID=A0ABN9PTW7_9DINO|nr:unnamed protein product [Polarella glacialis]
MAATISPRGPAAEGSAPRWGAEDGEGGDAGLAAGGPVDAGVGDDGASDAGSAESSAEQLQHRRRPGSLLPGASRRRTRQLRKERVAKDSQAPGGAVADEAPPGPPAGGAAGSPRPAAGEPAEAPASEEPAGGGAGDSAPSADGSEDRGAPAPTTAAWAPSSRPRRRRRSSSASPPTSLPRSRSSTAMAPRSRLALRPRPSPRTEGGRGEPAPAETPRRRLLQPARPEVQTWPPATPSRGSMPAAPSPSRRCWPQPPRRLPSFSLDEDDAEEEEEEEDTTRSAAASRNAWKQRGMDSSSTRSTEDAIPSYRDEESGSASARAKKTGAGIASTDGGVPRRKKKRGRMPLACTAPSPAWPRTRPGGVPLAHPAGEPGDPHGPGGGLLPHEAVARSARDRKRGERRRGAPEEEKVPRAPPRRLAGPDAAAEGVVGAHPRGRGEALADARGELISEPDRGPRRPCAAAVEKVILRELGGLAISPS